jgi:hypothetical protein
MARLLKEANEDHSRTGPDTNHQEHDHINQHYPEGDHKQGHWIDSLWVEVHDHTSHLNHHKLL